MLAFDAIYAQLIGGFAYNQAPIQVNKRTGEEVIVAPGGFSFNLKMDSYLPIITLRKTFPATAAAELAWFIRGERDTEWVSKYTKIWTKFEERLPTGLIGVAAAYGHRWRRHFGRDQLRLAIEALRKDPSDRRIYITAWDPGFDGLGAKDQKNVPCPIGFTLYIVDGALYSTYLLRSSDVFMGLPYDVMNHYLLMLAVAAELGVVADSICFVASHAHMYMKHVEMAKEGLHRQADEKDIIVLNPTASISQIEANPDKYVQQFVSLQEAVVWPAYNPRPELIV